MKKFISLLTIAALLNPVGATISIADYTDMSEQVESSLDIWVGGYLTENDNSVTRSFADDFSPTLPEAAGRVASNKAAEYHSLDSSPSGGILFKDSHAPNRIHLEFDFEDEDSWFGDLRYSYQDYFLLRILPRRLRHNLESLTLYDFDPTPSSGTDIEILDNSITSRIDDYGITMDIDEYRLRLKTPNFPLHLYSNGEIIRKKGMRQQRFVGGSAYFTNRVRVSEEKEIDQEKQEFSIGTNAHLGLVEVDISHQTRTFESDAAPMSYAYSFGTTEHHIVPKLEATTNTIKIHTSHSGRIFASTTYSEIEKTNETTTAEAENKMGYGELSWLPAQYFSVTTKYRHQKNDNNTPALSAPIDGNGGVQTYDTHPGVKSTTDIGSLAVRYSQIPSTNLKLSYTNKIKEVDDNSAIARSLPIKQVSNTYEMGITNWAIPKVRLTAKILHTNVDHDFGHGLTGLDASTNTPEDTNQGNLGLTWMISPRIATFLSATVTKEETDDNIVVGTEDHENAEALREQYLASITFIVNEKLSITPSYTYLSDKQKRAILWENSLGATAEHFADHDYHNQQEAHNVSLYIKSNPTKKLSVDLTADYTSTEGTYDPTSPFNIQGSSPNAAYQSFSPATIAQFSYTKTQEINVRLDTDYDLGHGWGIGVDVQYVDWKDDSFDNPSDSTFIGGLVKITKTIF